MEETRTTKKNVLLGKAVRNTFAPLEDKKNMNLTITKPLNMEFRNYPLTVNKVRI